MDPPRWGFGLGWHFCQCLDTCVYKFESYWHTYWHTFGQIYPHRWGFGSVWHFCQIIGSGWPLVRCSPRQRHLMAKCVTTSVRLTSGQTYPQDEALGQVDIWSDFGSGWPLVTCTPKMRLWVRLTFSQTGSGWPLVRCTPRQRHLMAKCVTTSVRLTSGQTYPQDEALGQVDIWSDFGSGWPLVTCTPKMRLWVRLTFSQTGSGWPLVRCTPRQRHLMAKCVTTSVRLTSGQTYPQDEALGQVDIWSDFGSGWPLVTCTPKMRLWVRLTFSQTGSGWPLVRCTPRQRHLMAKCVTTSVRLTLGKMYPPGWGFGSGWHLVRLWWDVLSRMRLSVRLTFHQTLGQADLWSDVPPAETCCGWVWYY